MTHKFLLPAGYLPYLAPYSIFKYYEELREQTGSVGFEYFYMVEQDPKDVNSSEIHGKIIGVHGPWTHLGGYYKFIFRPRVATNLWDSASKTLNFAKAVGAKYVVLHSIDIDEKFIQRLANLAKTLKIKIYLEPDVKKPGLAGWYYNTAALAKKFKFPVVFDPATVEWNKENLFTEWRKAAQFVGHVHLNEYQPELRKDQGLLQSTKYAKLIKEIKSSGYSGFYTFEISPLQNQFDFFIAAFFFIAAYSGITKIFPVINLWYARINQRNLSQSVKFAKENLDV